MVMQSLTHPVKVLEKLNQQRNQSIFTDINIIVAGMHYPLHKAIISAHSNVFFSILQQSDSQGIANLSLDILNPECFSDIVDFMYSSKLNISNENVMKLKETSSCLQMQDVVNLCNQFLNAHGIEENKNNTVVQDTNESTEGNDDGINKVGKTMESSSSTFEMPHLETTEKCENNKINKSSNDNPINLPIRETTPEVRLLSDLNIPVDAPLPISSQKLLTSIADTKQPSQSAEPSNTTDKIANESSRSIESSVSAATSEKQGTATNVGISTSVDHAMEESDVTLQKVNDHESAHSNDYAIEISSKVNNTDQLDANNKRGRKSNDRWTCDICAKEMSRSVYKIHMRQHTGEKEHKCDICHKSFVSVYNLKIHKRCHTGDKPLQCEVCDERFADPSLMRKHQLRHYGIKNHKCKYCEKLFATKDNLKMHIRSHTKEKPFVCGECGKAYSYRCDLNRHKRLHTGDLFGPCPVCGKKFNHRGNLDNHIKGHVITTTTKHGFPNKAKNEISNTAQATSGSHVDETGSYAIKFTTMQDLAEFVSSGQVEVTLSEPKKSTDVQENNLDLNQLLDNDLQVPYQINEEGHLLTADGSHVLLKDSQIPIVIQVNEEQNMVTGNTL